MTGRACRADGLRYELRKLDDPLDVDQALFDANDDPRVHGIIVYYPIYGTDKTFSGASHDDFLRDTISVTKDVEGLCHNYRTNLYRNVRFLDYPRSSQKCLLPCTALSVVKIIEGIPHQTIYNYDLPVGRRMEGQIVTVINRSEIVGRPLAAMLANDGATVYSVDIDSIYMLPGNGHMHHCMSDVTVEECVRKSSLVITGVPSNSYKLPSEWIQPNTTVINVSSSKNVDEEEILKIPGVKYVPMVGKVTVAMLERNLVRLFDNFHHPSRKFQSPFLPTALHEKEQAEEVPWYKKLDPLQLYTAAVATALFALHIASVKRSK
jgi:methylenetetrahydrofolate dehydrogenase (NAD+)